MVGFGLLRNEMDDVVLMEEVVIVIMGMKLVGSRRVVIVVVVVVVVVGFGKGLERGVGVVWDSRVFDRGLLLG